MSTSRVLGRLAASTAALVVGVAAVMPASTTPRDLADSTVHVILSATTSAAGRAAVESVGGEVTHELPFIGSVTATLPAAAVSLLERAPGVLAVVPDEKVHVQGGFSQVTPGSVPTADLPASVYREAVRSTDLVGEDPDATGKGVTVAVLDTGIDATEDLSGRVKKVQVSEDGEMAPCVNLSGMPTCGDDYGHGTFMAGLIAGTGASSGGTYAGVAPAAKLVSIKVGARDGSADLSNVLAGIQWAVSFKDTYGIKVLNLSLGTDSDNNWRLDPLNWAVEQAWRAGITVVVAASNSGPVRRTISKPGDDPYVITVGAADDQGTAAIGNDVVPDFSSRGPVRDLLFSKITKPDVVAPGARLVSVRAPGSTIDQAFADPGNPYLQGSGTSMATAVVSGVAAQILSSNSGFSPNRVKYVLKKTARPVAGGSKNVVGKGIIDAHDAGIDPPSGTANKGLDRALWAPTYTASRGHVRVKLIGPGIPIVGDLTSQNLSFPIDQITNPWTPTTWWASQWFNHEWFQTKWAGDNWEGDNWEGCFVGGDAGDECDYGGSVKGSQWYGAWD